MQRPDIDSVPPASVVTNLTEGGQPTTSRLASSVGCYSCVPAGFLGNENRLAHCGFAKQLASLYKSLGFEWLLQGHLCAFEKCNLLRVPTSPSIHDPPPTPPRGRAPYGVQSR